MTSRSSKHHGTCHILGTKVTQLPLKYDRSSRDAKHSIAQKPAPSSVFLVPVSEWISQTLAAIQQKTSTSSILESSVRPVSQLSMPSVPSPSSKKRPMKQGVLSLPTPIPVKPQPISAHLYPILQEFRCCRKLVISYEQEFPLPMGTKWLSVPKSTGSPRPYLSWVPPSFPILITLEQQLYLPSGVLSTFGLCWGWFLSLPDIHTMIPSLFYIPHLSILRGKS